MKYILGVVIGFVLISCQYNAQTVMPKEVNSIEINAVDTAYFASGCFWCVEAVFESVSGVKEAVSGYSGGQSKNPTYKIIGTGLTRHAEAVMVIYDKEIVSYETLVTVFFDSQDPTTFNRQGPDKGPQYRSIGFYQNIHEKEALQGAIEAINKSGEYVNKVVTEVVPLEIFYPAEDYHQNYERLHPENRYVQAVSIPRLKRFQNKHPDLLKKNAH